MADYRPSAWKPYFPQQDPIERCQGAIANYHPFSRHVPHVDPRFSNACYHRSAMPHFHDTRYEVRYPPAMAGYSGYIVPMTDR